MPATKEVSRVAKIIHQTMPGGRKKAGKKRVAAYARISCVKDAMLHSLSAQVSYFSDGYRIRTHPAGRESKRQRRA